jgi:hypothetical protein
LVLLYRETARAGLSRSNKESQQAERCSALKDYKGWRVNLASNIKREQFTAESE